MKQRTIASGFLVVCLVTVLFIAGCTSQNQANTPGQPAGQQPAVTATQPAESGGPQGNPAGGVSPSAADQGLVSDDTGTVAAQADAISGTQETNLTSDSPDLGDILP